MRLAPAGHTGFAGPRPRSTRRCAAAPRAAPTTTQRPAAATNRGGPARRGRAAGPRSCAARAARDDDVQPVPPAPLATSDEPEELQRDADWIAGMVALWLDEEWCPQDVHRDLGRAAGDAYARIRAQGEDEMGGLLLALSNELMGFNYRECFVGPFDVSNKVVEMLMQRGGTDVCCTTDADATRAARLEAARPQSE